MARLLYHEQNGSSVLSKADSSSVLPTERIFVDVVSPFERLCLISALVIGSVRVLEQAISVGENLLFKANSVLDLRPRARRLLLTFDMLADLEQRIGLGYAGRDIYLIRRGLFVFLALSYLNYFSLNKITDRADLRAVYSHVRAAVGVTLDDVYSRTAEITLLGVGGDEVYSRSLRIIVGRGGIFRDHVAVILAKKLNGIFVFQSESCAVAKLLIFRSDRVIYHLAVSRRAEDTSSRSGAKQIGLIYIAELYHRKLGLAH